SKAFITSNIFRVQENFLFYTQWNSTTLKKEYYLLGYDGKSDRIVLPSHLEVTHDKFTYYNISACAFYGSNLVSIEIGNGINIYGYNVFYKCDNLEFLILSNQIKVFQLSQIKSCSKCNIYLNGTSMPQEWEKDDDTIIAKVYYYYKTQPTEKGNYWHYVNSVPTKW
ncbi:MAG: leucine-rich repeat domain-containing protein, partial [Anaeroplasmataceae bacterium]|nr:leucine-rich repeat domain-containing protein [Anaeroplasmataceae bacterium]